MIPPLYLLTLIRRTDSSFQDASNITVLLFLSSFSSPPWSVTVKKCGKSRTRFEKNSNKNSFCVDSKTRANYMFSRVITGLDVELGYRIERKIEKRKNRDPTTMAEYSTLERRHINDAL